MEAKQFISETMGKGYDMDGEFGFQCWDYFAWFCKSMNYPIINCTSSGFVKDIWNLKNTNGVLKNFTITNSPQLGDWAIWGDCKVAPQSHIGMVEQFNGATIVTISQNQGGIPKVSRLVMSTAGVLGYLRPNAYIINTQKFKVGDTVRPFIALDYYGRKLQTKVLTNDYPVIEVDGDRIVLGNGLNTAFNSSSLKKSNVVFQLKVGSKVKIINRTDYYGHTLDRWVLKETFDVIEINSPRVVIGKGSAVTCAIHENNIQIVK